jgi:mono/diheme cytochrome c family protein
MFPRQHRSHRFSRRLALSVSCLLLVACEKAPPVESLQDWSPADHHSSDDDKLARGAQAPAAPPGAVNGANAANAGKANEVAQLVDLAWRQQCTSCHGPLGRGDGQMGPMVQAPNLTQSKATDAEMTAAIKVGRNRMPRFDLPDPVIAGLVARIRALQGR